MNRLLYSTGRWAALHPWRALAGWLAFTAVIIGVAAGAGGTPQDNWNVPDAQAQEGLDLLRQHVPGMGNANARVAVHRDAGVAAAPLEQLRERLLTMDHAVSVSEPVLSADRDTALLNVGYDVEVTHPDLMANLDDLEQAVAPTRDAGYQVEMNGGVPESAAAPMSGHGEMIGVAAALVILVLAFGSVVAAGLPIAVALAGLAAGAGGLAVLAAVMDVSTAAPTVATMVGLGVGIDYALLMATRHVEHLRSGLDVVESAARAAAIAGRSVVFAGMTVLVSLLGLRLADLPTFSSFGFATAITVVCVLAAALVLVPALCRLAGYRLLPRKVRRGTLPGRQPLIARWAARVGRRPVPWAVGAAALMVLLALPALDMRTWPQDSGSVSDDLTTRRAFDLVAEEFGPGANATMVIVVERAQLGVSDVAEIRGDLAARDDLVRVGEPVVSPDGAVAVMEVQPLREATHERTVDMVEEIRGSLPEGALLTGDLPLFADISEMLADRLPVVIAFVVGVSVLLLAMVFRSVVVPLKAAVMNLLSIGAAYGVLTAVFQWGWGAALLGLDHAVPVSSWIPILIFAILFGLSMDYEVFLLSRIREAWLATGDAQGSVVSGLADTGRVISAAAAIMVAVFLGFATEADVVVKMMGLGMAVAILLDATVVRMILVPATMSLLGRLNWWLPLWMERLLPRISVDLPGHDRPEPGAGPATEDDDRTLVGV
jgi:putative drug exporter of the RND superfamily